MVLQLRERSRRSDNFLEPVATNRLRRIPSTGFNVGYKLLTSEQQRYHALLSAPTNVLFSQKQPPLDEVKLVDAFVRITQQEKVLAQRLKELPQLLNALAHKEEALAQQEGELAQQVRALAQQEEALAKMERELDNMKEELTPLAGDAAKADFRAHQARVDAQKADIRTQKHRVDSQKDDIRAQIARVKFQKDVLRAQQDRIDDQQARIDEQRAQLPPNFDELRFLWQAALPSALTQLEAATSPKVAPETWLFSYPRQKAITPINIKKIIHRALPIEKAVIETLETKSDGPLIMGIQAGMGMGKSYAIDIADRFLFVDGNTKALVLKVMYDTLQSLSEEQTSDDVIWQGLWARAVLSVHRKVLPNDYQTVAKAFQVPNGKQLTAESVAEWICQQDAAAGNRPVILAVDEIGSLNKTTSKMIGDKLMRAVLVGMGQLVRALYSKGRKAIGLVTALPHDGIKYIADRTVRFLSLPMFTLDDSEEFLKANCSKQLSRRQLDEMLLFCGNHPQSLAVAANYFESHGTVPTPKEVAASCEWRAAPVDEATIAQAIEEAYQGRVYSGPADAKTALALAKLEKAAILMTPTGMFPPTALWRLNDWVTDNLRSPLFHIYKVFHFDGTTAAKEAVEEVKFHWNCFRSVRKLRVIPMSFSGLTLPKKWTKAPREEVQGEIESLKFVFTPKKKNFLCRDPIFGRDECKLNLVDQDCYYYPKGSHHRGVDSMCVAKAQNGERYLCLFHSTIGAEIESAVAGLNQAVKELSRIWDGKFLYIVYALHDDSVENGNGNHPLVIVDKSNMESFFTPTLSSAVGLHLECHRRSLEESPLW